MYFKRKVHCLVVFVMSLLLFVTVLSACNQTKEVQMEETTITTAVTSETTGQTLSEEELNALAQDMPEIVFVMSHHYDNPNIDGDETNILGYYITNTGEVKLYDFRTIAPDEIYEVPDVYNRLEEATCSEIYYIADDPETEPVLTKDDLSTISKEKIPEYYKQVITLSKTIEKNNMAPIDMDIGHYRYYGIRKNEKGELEFILLYGYGEDYEYNNSDPIALELWSEICFNSPFHLYYE